MHQHHHPSPLHELGQQLAAAESALRQAAAQCVGDAALPAGLLDRAQWCKTQFDNTCDRIAHGLARRLADNPRRD